MARNIQHRAGKGGVWRDESEGYTDGWGRYLQQSKPRVSCDFCCCVGASGPCFTAFTPPSLPNHLVNCLVIVFQHLMTQRFPSVQVRTTPGNTNIRLHHPVYILRPLAYWDSWLRGMPQLKVIRHELTKSGGAQFLAMRDEYLRWEADHSVRQSLPTHSPTYPRNHPPTHPT